MINMGLLGLGHLAEGSFKIEIGHIAEGCKEACAHCGFYAKGFRKGDFNMREVTRRKIKNCLLREVGPSEEGPSAEGPSAEGPSAEGPSAEGPSAEGPSAVGPSAEGPSAEGPSAVGPLRLIENTRLRLIDYFANYVTTNVNTEPLRSDAFRHFARLVKQLSYGASRVVCVSHGLRVGGDGRVVPHMGKRLDEIVEMMDEKDVFVLSLDCARSGGRISREVNVASYVETLNRLLPALRKGSRVTVSVQGDDNSNSNLFRGKAHGVLSEVLKRLKSEKGWAGDGRMALHIDSGRTYAKMGRARGIPGLNASGYCAVIPDREFVENVLDKDHSRRGKVDFFTGKLYAQDNNPARSYNTTVEGPWEVFEDDEREFGSNMGFGKSVLSEIRKKGVIKAVGEAFQQSAIALNALKDSKMRREMSAKFVPLKFRSNNESVVDDPVDIVDKTDSEEDGG